MTEPRNFDEAIRHRLRKKSVVAVKTRSFYFDNKSKSMIRLMTFNQSEVVKN